MVNSQWFLAVIHAPETVALQVVEIAFGSNGNAQQHK
jgi:hypothetical protein